MIDGAALMRALALIAGAAIVLATWQSIIVTIVLPRRSRNWIGRIGWDAWYRLLVGAARRIRRPERRDALLALLGPVNIVGLLFTWMALFVAGFTLVFWAILNVGFSDAFDLAGSSLFTLGFATGKSGLSHGLMYLAAASGMIVIGLQIGYLPTIYAAYSAREVLVTLLNMRAQDDGALTGASVLLNHARPRSADALRELYTSWESCAAAIVESHTNYPWLIVFRSPRSTESWITSMLAILDAIALLNAIAPEALSLEARHCRFACTAALNELARMLSPVPAIEHDPNRVLPVATISNALTAVCDAMEVDYDPERALKTFADARAEYEAAALSLGAFVLTPDSGWLRPLARERIGTLLAAGQPISQATGIPAAVE